MAGPFLTARWESLALLNFECPRDFLEPLVPSGTELDTWRDVCLISLVGFRFVDTRVMGVGIPCHRSFEEVNLRFYVRRRHSDGSLRRAVVFIKELVPRRAIALVARLIYNEPYSTVAMNHKISLDPDSGGSVAYGWVHRGLEYCLRASVTGAATAVAPGSEAEFITEHYWGYTRRRGGGTSEYRVDHPGWLIWDALESTYERPQTPTLFGSTFSEVLGPEPRSAFVAVGSEVSVYSAVSLAAP